jgi:hypothetical protein
VAAYCAAIKASIPLRDINGPQGGTDKDKASRYAAAMEAVLAASPPADKAFWERTLRHAQAIAQVDQSDDAALGALGQEAFALLNDIGPVAQRVNDSCGIDILNDE